MLTIGEARKSRRVTTRQKFYRTLFVPGGDSQSEKSHSFILPNQFLRLMRGRFPNRGDSAGIFAMLVRFFFKVFRKKGDAVRNFQNLHPHTLLPNRFLIAAEVGHVADDQPLELQLANQGGANIDRDSKTYTWWSY